MASNRTPSAESPETITVIGHRNPDADSVMAALGYAWLLWERDRVPARAARAGALNAQTTFAIDQFHLDTPPLLTDASPRIVSVTRTPRALPPDRPLGEAWALAAQSGLPTPIIEEDGTPVGLLTGTSVFGFLTESLADRPDARGPLSELPFGLVLATPCGKAAERDGLRFERNVRIRETTQRLLREDRDAFLVVDEQGRYCGLCLRADLFRPPRMRLVLVDHNEVKQAVAGIDEAELLEVLDHHRLANAPTHLPIAFQVDPVGSCSTLVAERAMRSGITVPQSISGALLSGILSDTLVLKSPTTTVRDRETAILLSKLAFPERRDSGEALREYGIRLLLAGAGLVSRNAEQIVSSDVKEYESGPTRFTVAQVEVTDLGELDARVSELREALDIQASRMAANLSVLMVTDVVGGSSRLVSGGSDARRVEGLPYPRRADGTLDLPGVVSRKKQLLPALLGLMED